MRRGACAGSSARLRIRSRGPGFGFAATGGNYTTALQVRPDFAQFSSSLTTFPLHTSQSMLHYLNEGHTVLETLSKRKRASSAPTLVHVFLLPCRVLCAVSGKKYFLQPKAQLLKLKASAQITWEFA